MSYKPVTVSQMECGRKIANEKKVGSRRFQKSLDDGSFGRFLDLLKMDEVLPTPGTRIRTLSAKITLDQPWQEAVNAAGPDTPDDYNVRKVGDLYLPTGTGTKKAEYVLLNYPSGDGSWEKALALAESKGLKKTVPREVFAVGRQYPKLHRELEVNPMYVVATTDCSFGGSQQACSVWWNDSKRVAGLGWVSSFGFSSDWFLFRKEPSASEPQP